MRLPNRCLFVASNHPNFLFRQPVQLVHELVNLSIRRVNLTLVQFGFVRPDRSARPVRSHSVGMPPNALGKPPLRFWQRAFAYLCLGRRGTHALRCEAAVGFTQMLGGVCPHDSWLLYRDIAKPGLECGL